MIDRTLVRMLSVATHELEGHESLVLEGEPRVLVVEEGSVAIFAAVVDAGGVAGPRRFLFRVGTGEPLVALPGSEDRARRFFAVPIGAARLGEVPLAEAAAAIAENERAHPLVDGWIQRLGALLVRGRRPADCRRLPSGGTVELPEGAHAHPESDTVAWVEVESGRLVAGSRELTAASGPFPCADALWITAAEDTVLRVRATGRHDDAAWMAAALGVLEALVLAHLDALEAEEESAERDRLRAMARRQAGLTEAALTELASILDANPDPPVRDNDLLTVVGAVADACGFAMKPPAASEDRARVADPIEAIARASHVRARRVLLEGKWWKRDCGPLVAYRGEDARPVALLQTKRLRYEVYDPTTRSRTKVDADVDADLHPEAVMFYRPLPPGKLRLRDLLKHTIAGRRRDIVAIGLTSLAATLLGMITPQATAVVMDSAIPDANRSLIFELGLALGAAAFGQAMFALSNGFISMRFGLGTEVASQAAIWDRILSLCPAFFRQHTSGDLQSRAEAATEIGRELNAVTMRSLLSSVFAFLNLGLLLYYSPSLTLIAVGITVVSLIVTSFFATLIRRRVRILRELGGAFYALVVQLIQGVAKLRVAGAEPRAYTQWVRKYAEQLRLQIEAERYEDYVEIFNTALPTVGLMCLFGFGFGGLESAGLTVGTFLAFYAAFGAFMGGATGLSNTVIGLLDTLTKAKRIEPILAAEPEVDDGKADPGRLTGRVEMQRVTFRYREDGPKILDEVSLRVEPGEFVALVGPSGSGKSTVFRLLLGFETPESGSVLFDGQDLAGVDVRAVRRQLGTVLQAGRLNTGSIFENIAGGAIVTMDEALEAAQDAGLDSDLAQMPMGMHTVISEGGGNLSGGQRQRLLIARALVQKPRMLLFDEATSALDNRTQEIVSKSLERRNVSRVVIAHRLSTIRQANRIYVIEAGRVAQEGTFVSLASRDGVFSRMMARQMA